MTIWCWHSSIRVCKHVHPMLFTRHAVNATWSQRLVAPSVPARAVPIRLALSSYYSTLYLCTGWQYIFLHAVVLACMIWSINTGSDNIQSVVVALTDTDITHYFKLKLPSGDQQSTPLQHPPVQSTSKWCSTSVSFYQRLSTFQSRTFVWIYWTFLCYNSGTIVIKTRYVHCIHAAGSCNWVNHCYIISPKIQPQVEMED